jgi:NAD(P)-dependent dehydrogenase (short-subunit alcohol dehydrogenase family)
MIQKKYGKVINIVSDVGRIGRIGEPGWALYSGSKAAVIGFSKALAKGVGRYKINVSCVAGGATYTETITGRYEDRDKQPAEVKEREPAMIRNCPMRRGLGRLGIPADLANAVTFLASDRAIWVTGQVLSVSGGYTTAG